MTDTAAMARLAAVPERVLLAPDSFKGTFSASQVVAAFGAGLAAGGVPSDPCPLADGGEGTLAALGQALGTEEREAEVSDPLGRPIVARFGLAGRIGVVECAAASGLGLVAEGERDAEAASTSGTGELIIAAIESGAERVLVGVGGSATTDGGRGAIEAIRSRGGVGDARLVVLCDVRTPWEQAARVFAPQKGANPDAVRRLSRRLERMAGTLRRDPRGVPMSGAAGGLAGGLWSDFDAQLVSGAAYVLEEVGFEERMRAARAVVTGEGSLDDQSLAGKVVSEVATRARQAGVPCYAVVGRCGLDRFGLRLLDLQDVLTATRLETIERAGRELALQLTG